MQPPIPLQQKSHIPLLGFGTWKLFGDECTRAISSALDLGYTHFDTADNYGNHQAIAKAIKQAKRSELFLTTKIDINSLPPEKVELPPKEVEERVLRFLDELQTDYLDLLLIHWPNPQFDHNKLLACMLATKEKGYTRHIGVSNFVRSHIEAMAPHHFPILTNQIELHPYLQRRGLVDLCKKQNIPITAFRPAAKGAFVSDPVLQSIGTKYNKSPTQVALRWLVQQDFVVIPKAASVAHMKANREIFDFSLSSEDMELIKTLDRSERYCRPPQLPNFEDDE